MMTTKFDRCGILLFCVFYLIFINCFQLSDAVECERWKGCPISVESLMLECPACVAYECFNITGYGCPSDFYIDCSNYAEAIAFINSKTPYQLAYSDGIVRYASGDEYLIQKFIILKFYLWKQWINGNAATTTNPIWYYKNPGDEIRDNSNGAVKLTGIMAVIGLILAQFFRVFYL